MTGKSARLRIMTTIADRDHFRVERHLAGDDGKEDKVVTMIHTRK